jgi:hypothetical protein
MGGRGWVISSLLLVIGGCYSGISTGRDEGNVGATEGADDSSASDGDVEEHELDPGRVTMHRLNRVEYDNTVRDLFYGLEVSFSDQFPADDHSYGFDNNADVLSVTPLLFELYERAAEVTLEMALAAGGSSGTQRLEAEQMDATVGAACCGGFWNLTTNGELTTTLEVSAAGTHVLRVRAFGQQGGDALPHMLVSIDGLEVGSFDVGATEEAPQVYDAQAELTVGTHLVSVAFTNDYYDATTAEDRNLVVDWVELEPPGGPAGPGDIRSKLLSCTPADTEEDVCSRQVVEAFTERAWRRSVTAQEVDSLLELVGAGQEQGGSWEDGIKLAMKAAMVSPHFVFRVELDPDPTSLAPHPLTDFELASRLSYFLWSSMPDDELFELARAGELNDTELLHEQVDRMLEDSKAEALRANFAGQWLYTRAISDELVKDPVTYPEFDPELRAALRKEMELFVGTFLTEGRSLKELLTAKETFVNDRLAAFYGIGLPGTNDFVRVPLTDVPRAGLLTQGGLLAVLSHPTITSPVLRGKWVLEQLLCVTPPPPPPDLEIPSLEDEQGDEPMRDRLARHREDPSCATCHAMMDPIGLALEHYDGIGKYRETEGPWPIDASGELPIGGTYEDALQMVALIADSPQFVGCTTQKTLIYALGRGIRPTDAPFLDDIGERFVNADHDLRELIALIVTSDVFRMRRGEPQE